MGNPIQAARDLCEAVSGVDWSADRVQSAITDLLACKGDPALDEAMELLLARLESSDPEDQDGVAQVAITAGTLVERGQPPERLGIVLLAKLPAILRAARRYADTCLGTLPDFTSEEEEEKYLDSQWDDALLSVDGKPVTSEMIRSHIESDRTGAVALAYLEKWVLPTVAAVSRSRSLRERASTDTSLLESSERLRDSTAGWLYQLFRAELDAEWLVVCPQESRAFAVMVDGVSSNFNLHEVVADVLTSQGIPGAVNPPEVLSYLRGDIEGPPVGHVVGSFNFYDYRALQHDVSKPSGVPHDLWVWNEGVPSDVETLNGTKILVAGPPAYERTWNLGRPFSALTVSAELKRELTRDELADLVTRSRDRRRDA